MSRATGPEDKRAAISHMRDTLVRFRMGVDDLRGALAKAQEQLRREEGEVEKMVRRKRLASEIGDEETVALAEQHERAHVARAEVLRRKVAAQEEELAIAAKDLEEMTKRLKEAAKGIGAAPPRGSEAREVDSILEDRELSDELEALSRDRARADRAAEADRRLAELKRRMGQ